jgi:3-hydroxymyristoyl/3-hydroxydecanoyl-(acyl carrier protein) dehydratase
MAQILRCRPACSLTSLDDVKFLAPVLPGSEVTVTFRESSLGSVVFVCTVAGQSALRGRASLAVGE